MNKSVENFFSSAEDFSKENSFDEIEPFAQNSLIDVPFTVAPVKGTVEENVNDLANINLSNVKNPFFEVFDSKSIVNRGNISDFIIEDLLKIKQEQEAEEKKKRNETYYIAKQELEQILNDNPGIKFYRKDSEGNIEKLSENEIFNTNAFANVADSKNFENLKTTDDSAELNENELIEIVIPTTPKNDSQQIFNEEDIGENISNENNDGEYERYNNYDGDEDEDTYYLSAEEVEKQQQKKELQEKLKGIQDAIASMDVKNEYRSPEEVFSEFLQENFRDYLLAKKITGNNPLKYSDKVIAQEIIEQTNKSVEIADFTHSSDVTKKTSILINRDDEMDIESIEILCKCGEKTVMKFDAVEGLDSSDIDALESSITAPTNTQIIIDTLGIAPLDYSLGNEK